MIEQEEKNKLNNKLTISNFVVGKSPIVIENVKDFYSSSHGFIYYQKDGIKYEYRGNYLFEFEINK